MDETLEMLKEIDRSRNKSGVLLLGSVARDVELIGLPVCIGNRHRRNTAVMFGENAENEIAITHVGRGMHETVSLEKKSA